MVLQNGSNFIWRPAIPVTKPDIWLKLIKHTFLWKLYLIIMAFNLNLKSLFFDAHDRDSFSLSSLMNSSDMSTQSSHTCKGCIAMFANMRLSSCVNIKMVLIFAQIICAISTCLADIWLGIVSSVSIDDMSFQQGFTSKGFSTFFTSLRRVVKFIMFIN